MKKWQTLLLALMLVIALCACKDKTEPEPTPEPETTETEAVAETAAPVSTELGSAVYETYAASFVGAEMFTATDGGDALRVYFDFTNLSDEAVSAADRLLYSAVQDGKTLNWAESPETLEEEGNLALRLQPGAEIRCVLQFALVSDTTVAVSLSDAYDHSVSALLSLRQLPGAPEASESAQVPVQTAQTVETSLPSECTLFDLYTVAITGGELDADGQTLTVSLEFTNKSDPEAVYPWDWLWLYAYQDGTELTFILPETEELTLVERGDSVTVTRTYELRSDADVLLELYGFREDAPGAGLVVPVG